MEDELRRSEALYRLLADNMNDLVWLMDLNLNTIYISPSVEKLQGLTLQENQQIPLNQRITPESYLKLMEFYNIEKPKILSSSEYSYGNTIDLEFYKKSGATYWLEINFSVIYNELSQMISVLCVGRDITNHKKMSEKLKESEEKLNLFFTQSLDGFFIMELDKPVVWNEFTDKEAALDYVINHQRVIKTNKALLDQYDATEDQILGKSLAGFFAHDPEQGRKVIRAFLDNGHLHIDTFEKKTDGTDIVIEGDYICLYDKENRITGQFGIQRDVTASRKSESALKAQLEELRRWQMVTLGREHRNMELKREVNELLSRLGEPLRYPGQQFFDSNT
jgi:PAS domain S-box-containing protein